MVLETIVSRVAKLAASAMLLAPVCAGAQSTTLLSEVHTIAMPDSATPVEHTFTAAAAGSYTITLTDLGAGLTPPAPLASAKMAVTTGNTVVGTPTTLQQGTATATLTFTATPNTTYTLHVVGSPPAGVQAASIGEEITAPDNSSAGSYVDSLALPSAQVPSGETIVNDGFTVASTDQYTVTLNDLQFPMALHALVLAVIETGATVPAATLSGTSQTTVTLNPGHYQIVVIGKTDSTVPTDVGGLFSASVVGTSGPPPYPTKLSKVGAVQLVQSTALPAGAYALTLNDLRFPAALSGGNAVLGATVVRDDGMSMAALSAAGNQAFTVGVTGNNYLAFAVANPPGGTAQGSYAVLVQSTAASPPPPAISVARAVAGATSTLLPFSFDATVSTAGSYVVTLTDFAFPGALTAANLAVVQGGALVGTPLTHTGNFNVTAAAGPMTLLAFSTASAAGGVFGVDVSPTSGSAVFDAAQPVGLAFVSRPVAITTAGSYQVSAADVGFPAMFSNFDVLVTHGTQSVGSIFGGGKFSFDATAGTYFVDFIALPSGTDKAGTYSLSVAPAPPGPIVTLNSNVTHVASGGTVTLTWTSQNATTCAASGGWSGTQPPNGSATSAALSGATTFTLTCSGDGGSANKSVSITIDSPTSPSGGGGHGGGAFNLLTLLGLIGALATRLASCARMSRGDIGVVRSLKHAWACDMNSAILKGFAASLVVLLPLLARAGDVGATASRNESQPLSKIRATMQERYPDAKVETIKPSELIPGWYELLVGQQIVYADPTADHLIVGKVVDTRTREDLTQKAWSDAHRVDFKALPFEHSIKTVRGKGEHVVAIFEDPLCPFCRKLEHQMQGVEDVTIYTFLLPLESIHPGATVKSREIWCAKDRAAAWSNWMLKNTEPGETPSGQCNADPTGLLLETASKLNINATPTLIFADGHRVVEAPSPEALESDLQHSILPN